MYSATVLNDKHLTGESHVILYISFHSVEIFGVVRVYTLLKYKTRCEWKRCAAAETMVPSASRYMYTYGYVTKRDKEEGVCKHR
jgi:hypothetical protein